LICIAQTNQSRGILHAVEYPLNSELVSRRR
jgi:hypothetical protein